MSIRATKIAPINGAQPHDFRAQFPDYAKGIQSLRRIRDREFAKINTLPGRDRHGRVRKLLGSRDLHLLYAYEALRKARLLHEATPERVQALAAQFNPFTPSDEPATRIRVAAGQRHRFVTCFGPQKRMHQLMVADLVRYLHPPTEHQFMFRGGMPAAFDAVANGYADGFTFGVQVDFTDFYGSVGLEGLADLLRPLPPSVVEHVVWHRANGTTPVAGEALSSSMHWAYPPLNFQSGLALGSHCSPIVGERIIATLLVPDDPCRVVTYADNLFVLGRSPDMVAAYFSRLQERASLFADWTLRPRMDDEIRELGEGFEFLHHEASIRNGIFVWAPDQRKLNDFLAAESEFPLRTSEITAAEHMVSHWRRAYPSWQDGDVWETQQLAGLAAWRFYKSASPLHKSQAATALIASFFASGRLRTLSELLPSGISPRDEKRRAELLDATEQRLVDLAQMARWSPEMVRPLC